MVIPSDSNKRGLNSFVFNTNKTCANTKVYRGVQPKVFTEAGIRNSVQVSPTCNIFSLITPGNFTEVFLDYKSLDEYKAAVNKAYKSYMVHVINSSIFRKNVTDSSHEEAPLIKGTIHNRVGRLTIDHTSKLVLQIMLSIMLLLEADAVWKMNLRGTLPRKPYSIASIMGFLAGSSICEPTFMPKGAEWMNKEELSRLFGDRTLGLGWWDDDHHDTGDDETEHPKNLRYGIDFGEPRERSFRAGRMNE